MKKDGQSIREDAVPSGGEHWELQVCFYLCTTAQITIKPQDFTLLWVQDHYILWMTGKTGGFPYIINNEVYSL